MFIAAAKLGRAEVPAIADVALAGWLLGLRISGRSANLSSNVSVRSVSGAIRVMFFAF